MTKITIHPNCAYQITFWVEGIGFVAHYNTIDPQTADEQTDFLIDCIETFSGQPMPSQYLKPIAAEAIMKRHKIFPFNRD